MIGTRAVAMDTVVARQVWATMSSPGYGHPASVAVAKGHGPCRHCLRPFRVGEEQRTLFTYNPFRGEGLIPLPGPVFLHAEECARFCGEESYPRELTGYPVVLDAYGDRQDVVRREKAMAGEQEAALAAMFADAAVCSVMVRDLKAGCFDFWVERRPEES